ncbi:helix-turn-helix domain-containing protein [Cellulomonas sp. NPDC089187]|uniref:TetR/AcrR family transcriptional regulator n=1 Tax=Cellulomonas sp. NPDC089187 TaxID=3154970 RepID=UPI00343E9454
MDDAPQDLRARRHAATHQEIHRAALDLFEQQGVRETTVQQIADRAGISTRTFFRHFTSKEQAALPGQRRLRQAIDGLDVPADATLPDLLSAVESTAAAAMSAGDEEARRLARLLAAEPDLRGLAAAQERQLAQRLRARLTALRPELDPRTLLVLAEVAVAVWNALWARWAETQDTDPLDLYRSAQADLRAIVR